MKIAGMQKFTVTDYPEKFAAVLFCYGCNLRCPWCFNPQLVRGSEPLMDITEDEVLSFLTTRVGKLGGVVFSGGEATLQPDLDVMMQKVKDLGFSVKLDTNGTQPEVVAALLDRGLLDYVGLDFKVEPARFSELSPNHDMWYNSWVKTLDLLIQRKIPFEIRTTVHSAYFTKDSCFAMARILADKGVTKWYWQTFFHPESGILEENLDGGAISVKELECWIPELEELLRSIGKPTLQIIVRE